MKLKKNDTLTLKIEDITNLGFGVAKHEGAVIFVSDTVPGDVVEAKIIKATSSYYVARAEKCVKLSEMRTGERCAITDCKSCAYRLIGYGDELSIKTELVKSTFQKAGLADAKIADTVPSPAVCGYRNKAQYPISRSRNGKYILGFYAPKTHSVREAAACPLAPSVFSEILELLRAFFEKHSLSVYDETSGNGLLRHVYLRRGEISREVLLTIVINGEYLPHADELVALVTERFPDVKGILLNENRESTNVVLGEKYHTLFGRNYIFDTLCGVTLKLTAPSFYQVNHDAAELLYKKARELANLEKGDTLLDLYCGVGSIGLSMAADAGELIGIEIVDSAVECARSNAQSCGVSNAYFYTGDAADCEHLLDRAEAALGKKIEPDVIVLDPPRSGCDEKLLNFISSLSPKRIVYISCNPATLARDVAVMKRLGYAFGEITPFDLFPGTGHVESVVCLTRTFNN